MHAYGLIYRWPDPRPYRQVMRREPDTYALCLEVGVEALGELLVLRKDSPTEISPTKKRVITERVHKVRLDKICPRKDHLNQVSSSKIYATEVHTVRVAR
jgi:hypothetical protein